MDQGADSQGGISVKDCIRIEARRFPVVIKNNACGEATNDTIILSKQQLQAAQLVGQSSKELICRLYQRQCCKVLDIGKAEKKTLIVDLDALWGMFDS